MVLKQFLVYYQIGENPVNVCRDPNDNFLLELAVKARAKGRVKLWALEG